MIPHPVTLWDVNCHSSIPPTTFANVQPADLRQSLDGCRDLDDKVCCSRCRGTGVLGEVETDTRRAPSLVIAAAGSRRGSAGASPSQRSGIVHSEKIGDRDHNNQ